MKKIERQKTLPEIRTFSDDPDSMKGDPLEWLSQFFDFIAVIFGLGIITLVIELIVYLIHNI
jgi:hypothetical protein